LRPVERQDAVCVRRRFGQPRTPASGRKPPPIVPVDASSAAEPVDAMLARAAGPATDIASGAASNATSAGSVYAVAARSASRADTSLR
jgi:hypothetical protein